MTRAKDSLTSCQCLFPDRFLFLDNSTVSPLWLRWVKGVCVFRYNLPPALLAEWPGSLRATAVTQGWKGHRISVSTQSYLWRKKFSYRSCWDSNWPHFDHESGTLTNQLSQLPWLKTDREMHCVVSPVRHPLDPEDENNQSWLVKTGQLRLYSSCLTRVPDQFSSSVPWQSVITLKHEAK